ncbi:glycosyl transferase family 2 [Aphanothece hegewaldii CCALA 016]|uniref:Glycosyl transferase family 2 n=1 Tax=Aphanothece hegewaldii CCALA 016 TaxID=2107694 RepID=A0A2T1LYF3_9CHRO|nr:HEAT repeat domain-containing protein [Aphanothece hegewaldii]PSF37426.1 glycosyl transferase family 2 [Aphanothece hegewaldii CCALA 016]
MSNPLSHAETDTLLKRINQEIAQGTFEATEQNLQQMVECLGDTRGMVRLGFAEALGEIGKPATPFLEEALLHHPNPVVRRASGKTLTLISDPSAVPTLIHALLNDEDTVVKGSAIGALARTGRESVPALLDILGSPDHPESTKGHAAWALSFIGAEGKEWLYPRVSSESVEVRAAIIGTLAKLAEDDPDEETLTILVNALSDPSENVRSEAAAAIGKLAYQPAIPQLVKLLQDSVLESRKSAALALMKVGDRSAIEPLQTALNIESEPSVQQIIKLAISQLEKQVEDEW